jgi:hypothetical protein
MRVYLALSIFFLNLSSFAQCLDFEVKDVSGNDVYNAKWNGISICEDDKEISIGSETAYISRSLKNSYGDFIFYIQERLGYGWPEVGYVKVASTLDIIEVKFMNSVVRYGVISSIQKAREEQEAQNRIDREKTNKLANDQKKYAEIDKLIKSNQIKLAVLETDKLNFPEKYNNYNIILKEKEKIAFEQKNEEEKRKKEEQRVIAEKTKNIELSLSKLIENGDYESAIGFFVENSNVVNLGKYYNSILDGLTIQLSKDTVVLAKEIADQWIDKNRELIKLLPSGKYTYSFNYLGVSINDPKLSNSIDIPYRIKGTPNIEKLQIGDLYLDGLVIKTTENEVVICSKRPIGSGGFDYAAKLCSEYKLGGFSCRLPTVEEFESIMNLTERLESYEKNWYWTSKTDNEKALHVGIVRGDAAYVPKEHGKWIFAVRSIPYFKVPLNSKLELSVNESKNQLKKIEYFSSSNKPIFILGEKNFYYKTKNNLPECKFILNSTLPKNSIREIRTLETTKTVNGIIVFKETKTVSTDFPVVKKD